MKRTFRFNASLILKILSMELYSDRGACLFEAVKNGAVACMPGTSKWQPDKVHIEITLVPNHPLAPHSTALVIMDRGAGFTEANLDRFCEIGSRELASGGRFGGASQKQVGRFAYFSLNELCAKGNVQTGFYVLTRTTTHGPVTIFHVTPDMINGDGITLTQIDPSASELGAYKNLEGSFSIIVIPNSVFSTDSEIRESLRWRIPRKRDRAMDIKIGGKLLEAPPLGGHTLFLKGVEIYLSKADSVTREGGGGLWLTDAETGLRCAYIPSLGDALPGIYRHPLAAGDVVVKNALSQQRTDRSGMNAKFFRSADWRQEIEPILKHQGREHIQKFLGEEIVHKENDPHTKTVREFADICESVFGPSQQVSDFEDEEEEDPPGDDGGKPGRPPTGKPAKPRGPRDRKKKRYMIGLKLPDGDYRLQVCPNENPNVYSWVSEDKVTVFLNPETYKVRLKNPSAQFEHLFDRVLLAIGMSITGSAEEALEKATAYRILIEEGRRKLKK